MNDKISVIVPVYNVVDYLEKCIRSITGQTYKNLEILLMDDGSNDGSEKLCDELARLDERIIVHHLKHGGVSRARNYGLQVMTGKYVAFCDADDWIEQDMYEYLYELMMHSKCNIASCGYWIENGKQSNQQCVMNNLTEFSMGKALIEMHRQLHLCDYLWCKLFLADIVIDISFDEKLSFSEDYVFMCQAIENSSGVISGTKALYHYIQRKNSVCNNGYSLEYDMGFRIREEYFRRYILLDPKHKNVYKVRLVLEAMGVITSMIKGDNVDTLRLKELQQIIRENLWCYIFANGPKLYLKGSAILVSFHFSLFKKIYNQQKKFMS